MFWPVFPAFGSRRIASAGTPSSMACSRKWMASPQGNRAAVVGLLPPVKTRVGEQALVVELGGERGDAKVVAAQADRHVEGPSWWPIWW